MFSCAADMLIQQLETYRVQYPESQCVCSQRWWKPVLPRVFLAVAPMEQSA